MRKFMLSFLALFLVLSQPTMAFAQNDADSEARLDAARIVVSMITSEDGYETAMIATLPLVRLGFQGVPGATAESLDQMEVVFLDIMMSTYPDIIEGTAVIYAEHFSLEELEGLTAFYQSPLGARLVGELPDITIESAAMGEQVGEQAVQANLARLIAVFE